MRIMRIMAWGRLCETVWTRHALNSGAFTAARACFADYKSLLVLLSKEELLPLSPGHHRIALTLDPIKMLAQNKGLRPHPGRPAVTSPWATTKVRGA